MLRTFLVWLVLALLCALHAAAIGCTPAERAELAPIVVPAERASCVLLTVEGVGEVCPTADELAPFAADLLRASSAPVDAGRAPVARLLVRRRHRDAGADAP